MSYIGVIYDIDCAPKPCWTRLRIWRRFGVGSLRPHVSVNNQEFETGTMSKVLRRCPRIDI